MSTTEARLFVFTASLSHCSSRLRLGLLFALQNFSISGVCLCLPMDSMSSSSFANFSQAHIAFTSPTWHIHDFQYLCQYRAIGFLSLLKLWKLFSGLFWPQIWLRCHARTGNLNASRLMPYRLPGTRFAIGSRRLSTASYRN